MILIGQFDSPFVRRVGIALRVYNMPFTHEPWSSFGDAERLAALTPLRRVPTLVLDDGEVLVDSAAILDHLDDVVGPARAMLPAGGAERRAALQGCVLATGLADKAVGLLYERILHPEPSTAWVDRCTRQIGDTLAELERRRAAGPAESYWFGPRIGHADVALACALRFLRDAHPGLLAACPLGPALTAHAVRCEALDPFREISQAFIAPRR